MIRQKINAWIDSLSKLQRIIFTSVLIPIAIALMIVVINIIIIILTILGAL
jgi:hypothetical protein